MTEHVVTVLEFGEEFVQGLTNICDLISRPWSKQRLQMTCFRDPPASLQWQGFQEFHATVYRGRWASITDASEKLRPLETALRFAWDPNSYGSLQVAGQEALQRRSVHAADFPINSEYWWRYLDMWLTLAGVVQHGLRWAESCPCHSKHSNPDFVCPLRGCRAPELACEQLPRIMDDLFATSAAQLIMATSRQLSQEDQQKVLSDWERGRRHLAFTLLMKTGCWGQLPSVCVGIAHHDEACARAAALKALQLYESAGDAYPHHALTLSLLSPGPARQQLELFITGDSLESLPLLCQHAARLKFILVAERWVEGLHALSNRKMLVARRHAPPMVGLSLHMNHIRSFLGSSPANLAKLAEYAEQVNTARIACEELGFGCHPVVQEVDACTSRKGRHTRLVEVIYHCDGPTLFAHYEWSSPQAPPAANTALPSLTTDGMLRQLEEKYAVDFVRDRMRELEGRMFSFKILDLAADLFRPLTAHINPQPALPDGFAGPTGICFCDPDSPNSLPDAPLQPVGGDPSLLRARRMTAFFRVVSLNPALCKTHHTVPTSKLHTAAIAISVHDILEINAATKHIMVASEAKQTDDGTWCPQLLLLQSIGLNCLESIRVWNCSSTARVRWLHHERIPAALQDRARVLLGSMVSKGCLPGPDSPDFRVDHSDSEKMPVMQCLGNLGVVVKCREAGDNSASWWRIAPLCVRELQAGTVVDGAKALLTPRTIPLQSFHTWELIRHLSSAGWAAEVFYSHRSSRVPGPYTVGEPKIWFCKPNAATLCQTYLLALALAPEHKLAVHHFQTGKWYEALLEGRELPPKKPGGGPSSIRPEKFVQNAACRPFDKVAWQFPIFTCFVSSL